MSNRKGSTAWFERGCDAWAKFRLGRPRSYACPLCLVEYTLDQIDLLSVDHVPAEALGGSRMVLTCKACNSDSGHDVQIHMIRRERTANVFSGELSEPHAARISFLRGAEAEPRASVNGVVFTERSGPTTLTVSEANEPEDIASFRREMEAAVGSLDWRFRVRFDQDQFHNIAARVGWLREAYLVAFAVFGYTYILDPALETVKRQIDQPQTQIIERFKLFDPKGDPAARGFYLIQQPAAIQSFAVQFGRHWVFLPWPGSDVDIYAALPGIGDGQEMVEETFSGYEAPWPTKPVYDQDFARGAPTNDATTTLG